MAKGGIDDVKIKKSIAGPFEVTENARPYNNTTGRRS